MSLLILIFSFERKIQTFLVCKAAQFSQNFHYDDDFLLNKILFK